MTIITIMVAWILLHGSALTVQQKKRFRKLNRKGLKWNSNADGIDDITSNSYNNNNINVHKDDISNGCNFAAR